MSGNRENRVRQKITKALQAKGWLVVSTNPLIGLTLPAGFPDLICIKASVNTMRVELIEVKVPKWREHPKTYPTAIQRKMHERLAKHGYSVRVARGLDDIADLLGKE